MPFAPSALAIVVDTPVSSMTGSRGRPIRWRPLREFAPFDDTVLPLVEDGWPTLVCLCEGVRNARR